MAKRCVIYARVSTKAQASDEKYSIPEQLDHLNKYADAMDWLVERVYVDPGHSGATIDRPALQDMLLSLDGIDVVLVDKLDRLSRSLADTLYLVKKVFEPRGVALVSRVESFDTGSSFGRAALGILGVFGELERERIKERTHDGMVGRAKAGYWHGTAPTGYRKDGDMLVLDELPAMQMRELFELVAKGWTLRDAIEKTRGKRPSSSEVTTVRRQLANRAYIGDVPFAGEWYQGLHDPIVDTDTFNAVQQILYERSRRNNKYRPGVKYTSPLGGLIWCKRCGAKYHYRLACCSGKREDGSKRSYRYTYYACYSRTKSDKTLIRDPNCKNENHKSDELESLIYGEIRALKADPTYIEQLRKSVDPADKVAALRQRITQLDGQIDRLMQLYSLGTIPVDAISSRVEPLTAEKRAAERQIADAIENGSAMSDDDIIRLADEFERTLAMGDSAAIHMAVAALIDYIEIDGDQIQIHWQF